MFILIFLLALALFAAANTEIRNFNIDSSGTLLGSHNTHSLSQIRETGWLHTLNATHNERAFYIIPAPLGTHLQSVCEPDSSSMQQHGLVEACSHELLLELDLRDPSWTRYDKFTIRISWPAFYPTDFDVTLYSPEEFVSHLQPRIKDHGQTEHPSIADVASSLSRTTYARIRLVDTGIRPPSSKHSLSNLTVDAVPFMVIVEPLLLGILPLTVVPTIVFLVPVIAGAVFILPHILRYLESIAVQARRELYDAQKSKMQ